MTDTITDDANITIAEGADFAIGIDAVYIDLPGGAGYWQFGDSSFIAWHDGLVLSDDATVTKAITEDVTARPA